MCDVMADFLGGEDHVMLARTDHTNRHNMAHTATAKWGHETIARLAAEDAAARAQLQVQEFMFYQRQRARRAQMARELETGLN